MFKVRHLETGKVYTVYAVVSPVLFLLYVDGMWCCDYAANYAPEEDGGDV